MRKHLAIAVGALLTLGTAVSATLNSEAQAVKPAVAVETTATQMGSKQSAQILALWKTHASSSGSVPLARPL
jgi:hypothetical protein